MKLAFQITLSLDDGAMVLIIRLRSNLSIDSKPANREQSTTWFHWIQAGFSFLRVVKEFLLLRKKEAPKPIFALRMNVNDRVR